MVPTEHLYLSTVSNFPEMPSGTRVDCVEGRHIWHQKVYFAFYYFTP